MTNKTIKHTPGPWHLKHNGIMNHASPTSHDIEAGDNIFIGHIYPVKGHTTPAESQANSHLIASAPELLEALKVCYRALTIDSDMEEDFAPEIRKALKAMSKAEGN